MVRGVYYSHHHHHVYVVYWYTKHTWPIVYPLTPPRLYPALTRLFKAVHNQ